MSYTTLDYLGPTWGKPSGENFIGICPLHTEQRPSFQVRPDRFHPGEWCWTCFHDKVTGDLPGLIHRREFGGVNSPSVWHEVFLRCDQLGVELPQREVIYDHVEPVEAPIADAQQRIMLTAVMKWWHAWLWSDSDFGMRGRSYYKKRGISLADLRFHQQVGYAPPTWHKSVQEEFFSLLQFAGGPLWKEMAIGLGLLSLKEERLRITLWDRCTFCSVNAQGECVYFQGRSVELPGDTRTIFCSYLGTKSVRKIPFTLAIPHPISPIETQVESAWGVLALTPYGYLGNAWFGGPSTTLIRSTIDVQDKRPRAIAMDQDTLRFTQSGDPYRPGEAHARKLIKVYDERGISHIPIKISEERKDLDTLILREGIRPFQRQLR